MKRQMLFIGLVMVFLGVLIANQGIVYAHCDTLQGPVIKDARLALQKGNVTPILKWVKKETEPEIRAAFDTALAERKTNNEDAHSTVMGGFVHHEHTSE